MKTFQYKTSGTSMIPLLVPGDIIQVEKTPPKHLRVDDFVTFFRDNKIITHRIIYKQTHKKTIYFITKGDHNRRTDGKVFPKEIIGKVVSVKRRGKLLHITDLYFFQSTLYFAELVKFKEILDLHKIDYVFLKGLPLHLYYEKTFPKRLYADADILIRRNQFSIVAKLLLDCGYTKEDQSLSNLHKIIDFKPEVQFSKVVNNYKITFDVHLEAVFLMTQLGKLDALYPYQLLKQFSDQLLHNKRTITVYGRPFFILKPEFLILYLMLHLFHHNFTGYYRYELIKVILKKSKINYTKLKDIISLYQLGNYIFSVFTIMNKHYGNIFPSMIIKLKVPLQMQLYFQHSITTIDIFSEETRFYSGVARFKHLFFLSPQPMRKKVTLIFDYAFVVTVLYAFFKILYSFLFHNYFLLKKYFRKISQVFFSLILRSTKFTH